MTSDPDAPVPTLDGSFTCRHPLYRENYHAREGARSEAFSKFIGPSALADRLRRGPVRLLDVGFGLGMNALSALTMARETSAFPLQIDSLESEKEALHRALRCQPDSEHTCLQSLIDSGHWQEPCGSIHLHWGDLRQTLPLLAGPYDLIFHDPFSPLKNTEAWTVEVFAMQRALLAPEGLWLSYAEARAVRAGLLQAGWYVGTSPARPPHRGGTIAAACQKDLPCPLNDADIKDLEKTTAYHDLEQTATSHEIRSKREASVRRLNF
jgi:uncharacterized protein